MAAKKRAKKTAKKSKSKPKKVKPKKRPLPAKSITRSQAAKKGWETRRENERKKELAKQLRKEARERRKQRLAQILPTLVIASTEQFKREREIEEKEREIAERLRILEEGERELLKQRRITEIEEQARRDAEEHMRRISAEEEAYIMRRKPEDREYYRDRFIIRRILNMAESDGTFDDVFDRLVEAHPEYTQSEIYTMWISDLEMTA